VEKELLYPLPCSAAGRVATGQPIRIVNVPHVTVIIRHNSRVYRIPVLIAIIAFPGSIVNVFSRHTSLLSFYTTAVKSPLPLTRMSPRFRLSVLGLRSLSMRFLCSLKFSSVPSRHVGQGRRKSCPFTVYGQILLHPLSDKSL